MSSTAMLAALSVPALDRAPLVRMQLLGPDGQPIGGGSTAGGSTGGGKLLGVNDGSSATGDASQLWGVSNEPAANGREFGIDNLPEDLADFDPTYDPLAAPRPKYDLAAASGRGDEAVWGAAAPESAERIGEWVSHIRAAGVERVLGLFSVEQVSERSPNGTPQVRCRRTASD